MNRRQEAAALLRSGLCPSEIARQMGVTGSTVIPYLLHEVGRGVIRRSDVLFSIPSHKRALIEQLIESCKTSYWFTLFRVASQRADDLDRDDLQVYLAFRDARVSLGDMYELLRDLELSLHRNVQAIIIAAYGAENWWRLGVPEAVRVDCASARERDPEPAAEAYAYTTLMHLRKIIDDGWSVIGPALPSKVRADKRALLADFARLNRIRNSVMHPCRATPPDELDFQFVREFHARLSGNASDAWTSDDAPRVALH
jgi:hypothetical protein